MTSTQAVRAPRRRRAETRRVAAGCATLGPPRHARRGPGGGAPRRSGAQPLTTEVRSFVSVSVAIGAAFALVLLYLSLATAVSAAGYEAQRLAAERAELRRQNALLEIESARLASPARIETAAAALGLRRAAKVTVVPAEAFAAVR